MSWHCSRALVEAFLEGNSSDGALCAPSKLNRSAETSSCVGKTMDTSIPSPCGMTFAPSTGGRGEALLTWFREASRVRTSVPATTTPPALTVSEADCGQKWRESSVRYDRASCSWRTHRCLWDEGLPESSVTLPKWGRMTADGVVLERTTLPLPTSARDAGLSEHWPTPRARDWKDTPGVPPSRIQDPSKDSLPQRVWRLWPTPRAAEGGPDFAKLKRGKRTGQSVSPSLATAVALENRERFPTPRTTPRGCKQLGGVETGPLNPTFREWLMGWPIDWTARRPLETDKYREWWRSHGTCCVENVKADRT